MGSSITRVSPSVPSYFNSILTAPSKALFQVASSSLEDSIYVATSINLLCRLSLYLSPYILLDSSVDSDLLSPSAEVVTSSNVRKSSGRSGSSTLSSCPTLLSGMVYTTESVLDLQYTVIVLAFGSLFTNKSSALLSPGWILTSSILDR